MLRQQKLGRSTFARDLLRNASGVDQDVKGAVVVEHVLRVNGHGRVVRDPEVLGLWPDRPPLAIVVDVEETFVHCGRALRTSGTWQPEGWADPSGVPSTKELAAGARATRG